MKIYNAYDIFSEFYDEFIAVNCPDLHNKYVDLVQSVFNKLSIEPKNILDCTCGTGILIKRLNDMGYRAEGMDSNLNMLSKAKEKGLKVHKGDIRDFDLKESYDVILSFDSLGHIGTQEGLERVLNSVKSNLSKDGVFLFDGGTKEKALRMVGQQYTFNSDKYSFVWDNFLDDGQVRVKMNISKVIDNGEIEECIEEFNLCGHDIEEIKEAVLNSGLKLEFITLEPLVKMGSFICCCRK